MSYWDSEQERLHYELMKACKNGDLDQVKYLLTSPDLDEHASINYSNDTNSPLTEACWYGHIDIVDFLLTSSELEHKADIHFRDDQPLRFACYQGKLDVVDYLLTSYKLKDHANINIEVNEGSLGSACDGENLNVIKYLIESDKLKEKINIESIYRALESLRFTQKTDIVEYFIFNETIDLCNIIREVTSNWSISEEIEKMLQRKELMQSLKTELITNPSSQNKHKI